MSTRKKRVKHSIATKLAAVQEVMNGARPVDVVAKYNIVSSLLRVWQAKAKAGKFGKLTTKPNGHATPNGHGKLNGHAPPKATDERMLTPEKVFGVRVQKAIDALQEAQKMVKQMEHEGKIKQPDTAHLLATLALRHLQGDYGA